jgi:hypothetical protein
MIMITASYIFKTFHTKHANLHVDVPYNVGIKCHFICLTKNIHVWAVAYFYEQKGLSIDDLLEA